MNAIVRHRTVSLMNGDLADLGIASLRLQDGRITAIGAPAECDDIVVDLRGDRVLPGLINAHDHLQLNNYPRLKFRDRHHNVAEWIADIEAQRDRDAALVRCAAVPREARLLIGAMKNLLSGVTTVAHHDPGYASMFDPQFPVCVLADYGWTHSIGVDGLERVRDSHRASGPDVPWFIHAGEGVDDAAAAELNTLDRLGAVTPNSLLVHAVAFDAAARRRVMEAGAGVIWCPSSNLFLFGRTAEVADLAAAGRVALGSDSRLSGERDLLEELRVARRLGAVPETVLESLVTVRAAALLRLPDRGVLKSGALADLVILPRGMPLWEAQRADLRGVMTRGVMRYGDASYAELLMTAADRAAVVVDGREKFVSADVAEVLRRPCVLEPGVQMRDAPARAA